MKVHLTKWKGQITREHVSILGATTKSEIHLKTLEALWIREYRPYLNTQDTMKSRDLKNYKPVRTFRKWSNLCENHTIPGSMINVFSKV